MYTTTPSFMFLIPLNFIFQERFEADFSSVCDYPVSKLLGLICFVLILPQLGAEPTAWCLLAKGF